jgi:hypothetical protein
MSNANTQRPPRARALAVLLVAVSGGVAGCATTSMLAGKSDWTTLYPGTGSVDTRVVNESGETITVRILDEHDEVIAQAPLAAHAAQTLELPPGTVRATVRVIRDGHASYTDPEPKQVDKPGAEWQFTAPTME